MLLLLLLSPLRNKIPSNLFPRRSRLSSVLILLGSEDPGLHSYSFYSQLPSSQTMSSMGEDSPSPSWMTMTIELDDLIMCFPGCLGDSWLGLGCNLWLWN